MAQGQATKVKKKKKSVLKRAAQARQRAEVNRANRTRVRTLMRRLRTAITAAKAVSMPADNIKKAIMRGTGELEGGQIDEVMFEGYGPGGAAVLVKVATDNRNPGARSGPRLRLFRRASAASAASRVCAPIWRPPASALSSTPPILSPRKCRAMPLRPARRAAARLPGRPPGRSRAA